MVVRDRRVLLDRQLELDLRRVGQLALELAELLLRIGPDRVADLDVLAFDLQAHRDSPSCRAVGHLQSRRSHRRTARAKVTTSTEAAPAARSALAAAETVAPVV